MAHATGVMPPDPTDTEDAILLALFAGQPSEALARAAEIDIWLSAHWADLMESLDLIEAKANEEYAAFVDKRCRWD